jgi:hypothetical protein
MDRRPDARQDQDAANYDDFIAWFMDRQVVDVHELRGALLSVPDQRWPEVVRRLRELLQDGLGRADGSRAERTALRNKDTVLRSVLDQRRPRGTSTSAPS